MLISFVQLPLLFRWNWRRDRHWRGHYWRCGLYYWWCGDDHRCVGHREPHLFGGGGYLEDGLGQRLPQLDRDRVVGLEAHLARRVHRRDGPHWRRALLSLTRQQFPVVEPASLIA